MIEVNGIDTLFILQNSKNNYLKNREINMGKKIKNYIKAKNNNI